MAQSARTISIPEICLFTKSEYNSIAAARDRRGFSIKNWFKKDFVDSTFRK